MSVWEKLTSGQVLPGVYRLPARTRPASVRRAVEPAGWRVFSIDGKDISDKPAFLGAVAAAMQFPDYVAKNWDAFEEAVRDLEWAPARGYVLIYAHAGQFARSHDWPTALSILNEAIRYWQTQKTPLYVLLGDVPDTAELA